MTYSSSKTGAQVDAAVDDVQEAKAASATDTTAGRLLKVGDYGAGAAAGTTLLGTGNTPIQPNATDLEITDKIVHSGDLNTAIRFPAADTVTVETAGTESLRIDPSGNVLIGTTSPAVGSKLLCRGSGTGTNRNLRLEDSSGTEKFAVYDNGSVIAPQVYENTTASAANMVVLASGSFLRSTSSARYKENIRDYDQQASIDALRPVFFNSKNADDDKLYAGLIAEEVAEAGFEEFVERNPEDQPDAVFYQHMVALCIKEIQSLRARVSELENKQ